MVFVPLSKMFEKKISAVLASIVAIAVGTGPYLVVLLGWTPNIGAEPVILYVLLALFVVFAALGITAAVLAGSMMADVVEHAALETGRRSEGTFFAAISLMNKAVSGAGIFLAGQMMALAKFPEHANPATLDPAILHRLLLIYVPTGILLHVGAIVAFLRYPITRKDHEANVLRLRDITPSLAPEPGTVEPTILGGELTMTKAAAEVRPATAPGA
jgi:GPH family glycoside/pentoside/hexuronide:cation symporter